MVLYIIAALIVGIYIGRVWRNVEIQRACDLRRVLSIDGKFYGVHRVDPDV